METAVKTNLPLQDAYLLAIKRENALVTIYLRNGFQLRGHVRGFDNFTIILEYDNKPHLVYKHAISTVSPQSPVQFSGADIAAHQPRAADVLPADGARTQASENSQPRTEAPASAAHH